MRAFSLIEMIFVIVILSLLSAAAISSLPDNTLKNNAEYLKSVILEKKANALSFMADMNNKEENESVCIEFNADWLRKDEEKARVKFNLSKRIEISSPINTLCFDYLGRPYKGRVDLENFNNLLHDKVEVNLKYVVDNTTKTIIIFPITGYLEIK